MKKLKWIKVLMCLLVAPLFIEQGWAETSSKQKTDNAIRTAAILNFVLSKNDYIKVIGVDSDISCVHNGGTVEIAAIVKNPDKNHLIEWEYEGDGDLKPHSAGTRATFTAPLSGSEWVSIKATVVYTDTSETDSDYEQFYYGACPNRAVFYRITGNYSQPGLDLNCDTLVAGGDQYEYTNDNPNGDGRNPEIPLDSYWAPNDQFENSKDFKSIGDVRGVPSNDGGCAVGNFPANSAHYSLAKSNQDGFVYLESALSASATCNFFTNGEYGCSSADTSTEFYVVYEMDIDTAIDYRLEARLECAGRPRQLPIPAIRNIIYRYKGNGELVVTDNIQPYFSPPCDNDSPVVEINRVVNFGAPEMNGVDRVVVQFITFNVASSAPEIDGVGADISALQGIVRVSPVQN